MSPAEAQPIKVVQVTNEGELFRRNLFNRIVRVGTAPLRERPLLWIAFHLQTEHQVSRLRTWKHPSNATFTPILRAKIHFWRNDVDSLCHFR